MISIELAEPSENPVLRYLAHQRARTVELLMGYQDQACAGNTGNS